MTLRKEDRNALVTLRLEKAKEALIEAKGNIELGHWRVVANRLYYTCFYAASALLIQKGITARTHSGVMNQFGLHFVENGLIGREQNKLYGKLFGLRQTGDYDDLIILQEYDVIPFVEPVEKFIEEIENIINEM
jgi:uncharacterized protein (UPF0332 family)